MSPFVLRNRRMMEELMTRGAIHTQPPRFQVDSTVQYSTVQYSMEYMTVLVGRR